MRRKVTRKKRSTTGRKTTTRRRRRISGIGRVDVGGLAMKGLGLVAGSVAARELNTLVIKMFPSFSPKTSGLVQMAAGFILPMVVKGNKFVGDMGDGMIANGGMVLAVNMGLINGLGNVNNPSKLTYRINGNPRTLRAVSGTAQNLPAVSGTAQNLPTVSGSSRRAVYRGCY